MKLESEPKSATLGRLAAMASARSPLLKMPNEILEGVLKEVSELSKALLVWFADSIL